MLLCVCLFVFNFWYEGLDNLTFLSLIYCLNQDLTGPTAKRLRRQLSAVINFCKFRDERTLMYEQLSLAKQGVLDALARERSRV